MPSAFRDQRLRLTWFPLPSKIMPASGLPDTEFLSSRLSPSPMRNMPMSPLSRTEFPSIRTSLESKTISPAWSVVSPLAEIEFCSNRAPGTR